MFGDTLNTIFVISADMIFLPRAVAFFGRFKIRYGILGSEV